MKETFSILCGTLLLGASLALPLPADDHKKVNKENATEHLTRAEALARDIRESAGELRTFTRFPMLYSKESHQRKLMLVKENAEELGSIVQKLHTNREGLAEWQAELVTRMLARLDTITSNTEDALKFANNNPESFFQPRYGDSVDSIYSAADNMVRNVDRYLEWANAKAEKKHAVVSRR